MLRRMLRQAQELVVALFFSYCLSVSYIDRDRGVSRGRARARAGARDVVAQMVKTLRRGASAQVAGGMPGLTGGERP
ncbi:hypothetical protein B5F74_02345 [Collinsella sp. An271]|nr:hypothetical protein B5F74_02345 [Collinsella sp. An271]